MILFGQSSSHTQTAKATYHVTFHLAIETSVEAELTQMESTNLGSPEPRKCQSRCILIPIPVQMLLTCLFPHSLPTTNLFQYSLKPRCLRLLKGLQTRKRSIQSMKGLERRNNAKIRWYKTNTKDEQKQGLALWMFHGWVTEPVSLTSEVTSWMGWGQMASLVCLVFSSLGLLVSSIRSFILQPKLIIMPKVWNTWKEWEGCFKVIHKGEREK